MLTKPYHKWLRMGATASLLLVAGAAFSGSDSVARTLNSALERSGFYTANSQQNVATQTNVGKTYAYYYYRPYGYRYYYGPRVYYRPVGYYYRPRVYYRPYGYYYRPYRYYYYRPW